VGIGDFGFDPKLPVLVGADAGWLRFVDPVDFSGGGFNPNHAV